MEQHPVLGNFLRLTVMVCDKGLSLVTQTLQRFIKGQADAYSLSVAQSHWQTARQNQIASLQNYWLAYYHLRRLTLYDYQRRQTVTR